ncbi:unnamed protein product, partial [Allacma fusca]
KIVPLGAEKDIEKGGTDRPTTIWNFKPDLLPNEKSGRKQSN